MGETWRGIYLITAFVRDALHKKAASAPRHGLSPPEATLLTVCNFWHAVNTGSLLKELSPDALAPLTRAQEAFVRVGAIRVASTLRAAIAQLTRSEAPVEVRKTVVHIEDALSRTEDHVDDLIAHYAIEQMGTTTSDQHDEFHID